MRIKLIFPAKIIIYAILMMGHGMNIGMASSSLSKTGYFDSIAVNQSRDISYGIYWPSASDEDSINKLRIVYIFEPLGRVNLAMDLFSPAADQGNYLLVCSYQSKNGPLEANNIIFEEVMRDLAQRYGIIDSGIFLAGFSGGSRAAYEIASRHSKSVAGILGCGSGLPPGRKLNSRLDFIYAGIVGILDMNFYEMNTLEKRLEEWNSPHLFYYFDGGHQWPESDYLANALEGLTIQSANVSIGQKKIWVQGFQKFLLYNNESIESRLRVDQAAKYVGQYEDMMDVSNERKWLEKIRNDKSYRKASVRFDREKGDFLKMENTFLDAVYAIKNADFQTEGIKENEWWEIQARMIQSKMNSKIIERSNMGKRIYDFYWRNLAEQGSLAYSQGNYQSVLLFDDAWKIVQPENPSPYMRSAMAAQQIGDLKRTIKEIAYAIQRGFADKAFLERRFESIAAEKDFQKILDELSRGQ